MKDLGRNAKLATELGLSMGVLAAAWTLLGLWAGLRVDAKLGTAPIATLVLLLTGTAAGQFAMFRMVARVRPRLESGASRALSVQDGLWAGRLALALLLLLALPVLGGLALGVWLDGLFGTHPLFILVLSLGGLGSGLYGVVRVARR